MTVEEITGSVVCNNKVDNFPIGMRVLAVDDNPTCLKVLDSLLRKCQYHVTTTNEAVTALKMLRENRNRFDLIISDVYMPDMDGFKLLELVGLEMDLPVIMLSGNSDPKLVMKGITHGACDYLVKPVRLEELRNIWQHVIRRKVETKSQSKSNNNERSNQGNEGGDQIVKVNRKRKDEDDDDENENGDDSDDPFSTQKRPRVVWSIDLHKKFVAAVNQLGIEKAVPKRILDLMNVDGLTRENVASHLQKYRLYLRRISQHTNMMVAFGASSDASSYLRMNSVDGIGDFRTLPNSGRLPSSVYSPSGMLGRLNSTSGVTLHSLAAPPFVQPNHTQNKLQAVVSSQPPNHQNVNPLPGIPPSFDLDNQQYGNKPNAQLTEFGTLEESQIFSGTKLADFTSLDESRMLTGSRTFADPSAVLSSQSSLKLPSTDSESFNLLSGGSSFLDQDCHKAGSFSSNQLPIGENYSYTATVTGGFGSNITATATAPLEANGGSGFVSDIVPNVDQSLPNQYQQSQNCGNLDYSQYSHNAFSSSPVSGLAGVSGVLGGLMNHSRSNGGASTLVQIQRPSMQSNEDYSSGLAGISGVLSGLMNHSSSNDASTLAQIQRPSMQSNEDYSSGLAGVSGVLSGLMNHSSSNGDASTLAQIQRPSMQSNEDYSSGLSGVSGVLSGLMNHSSSNGNASTLVQIQRPSMQSNEDYSSGLPGVSGVFSGLMNHSSSNGDASTLVQVQRPSMQSNEDYSSGLAGVNGVLSGLMSYSSSNDDASALVQIQRPSMQSNDDYLVNQTKLQGGFFASNGYGSFDDIMTGMMKKEQDPASVMAGDFGFDHYSFGSWK